MQNYPLECNFKLLAFAPQVRILDSAQRLILYVRQKALALKEDVKVFADEKQTQQLFQVKADRIIDFSARYTITTVDGQPFGGLKRQGAKSLWKATYEIHDPGGNQIGLIQEEEPWLKVADAILSEIPIVGFLTIWINPAYKVSLRGQEVLYLKKQPSLVERKFRIEQRGPMSDTEEALLLNCVIMLMLMERSRG